MSNSLSPCLTLETFMFISDNSFLPFTHTVEKKTPHPFTLTLTPRILVNEWLRLCGIIFKEM